jgi:hypothetical protein
MAIKKCVAARLGVIYDSQTANRKQGRLPAKTPAPSGVLLLVAWESFMIPSRQAQKYYQIQLDSLTFRLKNRLKQYFLNNNC